MVEETRVYIFFYVTFFTINRALYETFKKAAIFVRFVMVWRLFKPAQAILLMHRRYSALFSCPKKPVFDWGLWNGDGFSVHCLAFCFGFELSQKTQNKSSENHLYTRKMLIRLIFNLVLALTCFQTTWPYLQQVNLTFTRDLLAYQHLVSGQLRKNMWSWWPLNLSPQYDYVILVSVYFDLTGVNWS